MEIIQLQYGSPLGEQTAVFPEKCAWIPGKHFAALLRENCFSDWEACFAAAEDQNIIGYCTFLKEDYYPENRYSPWISSIFVTEAFRGRRISHKMIEAVMDYAKKQGFQTVYIPAAPDMNGFYEKCGFTKIDTLKNYSGDIDNIYMRVL